MIQLLKVLIVCLVLTLSAVSASPISYEIDVGQDGIDTGGTLNLFGQTGVDIDIILDGYACPPRDDLFGVQVYVILDGSLVQVNDCYPNADGGCDLQLSGCQWQGDAYYTPDPDVWLLICSNFQFIGSVSSLPIGTFNVDCIGTGITNMVVANDLTSYGHPDFDDGYLADCNLERQYPVDGIVTIEHLPPTSECHADVNCSTKIDLSDLAIMRGEFLRDDCDVNPCDADCNYDNKVDLSDLVMMQNEFLRTDCPACP